MAIIATGHTLSAHESIYLSPVITNKDAWYAPFFNWDGQHYLRLADEGYAAAGTSQAFFPLLPLLMGAAHYATGQMVIAALLINSAASLLFIGYFHRYARRFLPENHALLSVVLALSFPTAFYLTAIYPAALFLCCLFAFLYYYRNRSSVRCALFAALLPLIRGQALFVALTMVAFLLWRLLRKERIAYRHELAVFAGFAAGGVAWLAFYYFATGSPLSGFHAQAEFGAGNRLANLFNPFNFFAWLFSEVQHTFAFNGWVNRVFAALMLAAIIIVAQMKDRLSLLLYSALAYFSIAMGAGVSYPRFALLAFPFLAIAWVHRFPDRWHVTLAIAGAMMCAQIYFAWRFSHFLWVS